MNGKIFFIHVPKTAGLTTHCIFGEILGPDRVIKLGASGSETFMTMAEFRALPPGRLAASPVITGHFSWGCQNRLGGGPRQTAMALREPCTRVLSYIDYQGRAVRDREIAHSKLRTDPECNNGMVRRLRGLGEFDDRWWDFIEDRPAEPLADLGPEDFDLACRNLAALDTVLLTEKFVDGCVLWRHRLGMPPLVSIQNQFRNHAPLPTEAANWQPVGLSQESENFGTLCLMISEIRMKNVILGSYFCGNFVKALSPTGCNWPADFIAEVRERNALDDRLYEVAQARATAELDAASPAERDEMVATRCLAGALMRRGQADIDLRQGVGSVLHTINRLVAEGHPEIGVRVGYLLAERAPLPTDLWTPVTAICRRVCPHVEVEIDAARWRAHAVAKAFLSESIH